MLTNLVSCKTVIAKVFTDLNLQESPNRILDMVEWTGEAMAKIGAFPTLKTKVTGETSPIIKIENYQAKLPCDLHSIIQVGYGSAKDGPFFAMKYDAGSMAISPRIIEPSSVTDTGIAEVETAAPTSDLITITQELYSLSYSDAVAFLNNNPNIRQELGFLVRQKQDVLKQIVDSSVESYRYIVVPGYIKTNTKTGYLKIAYKALPVDEQGWPMIPDDESFKEAIFWYINMKLMYPEWKEGRVRDVVYYDARSSWNYYCKQAYGYAMIPNSTDQLEALKNTWLRLVPEIQEHETFFSTLSDRQFIYNKNK